MRVLIVNTSECTGGAAVAAKRLAQALINHGVKAKMMVCEKQTDALYVTGCGSVLRYMLHFLWERVAIWARNLFSKRNLFEVSIANTGMDITALPEFAEADIIHLHWINQGMLSLAGLRKILRSGKPVVWTMHDMWPCTGICHHAHGCDRYHESCGHCPFLRFPGKHDLSHRVFERKRSVYRQGRLSFVAVSTWLAKRADASALLRGKQVAVIPNSLSLEKFKMQNRADMRSLLHISARYVVVFGAARIDAPIKGFAYLKQALARLVRERGYKADDVCLLLFGNVKDSHALADIPVPYMHVGWVRDEHTLSQIYSAADALVSSSLYETFGQTLIEAQACGCLPVSFDNSGQTDIITHRRNGYLARYRSAEDLAAGIDWCLNAQVDRHELRKSVLGRYSESKVAQQYVMLYRQLLEGGDV